jgi:predicted pyridoxine 5'-phosphate oxidase superfamily flavin-nucleotide-binding protein
MAELITDEMKAFIEANRPSMVATASKDGEPNASPRRSLQVLDPEHLLFVDVASPKSRKNILETPRVCVTVINAEAGKGYQFKGNAEYVCEGPLYDRASAALRERMPNLPKPYGVVKIHVDKIFTIG